LSNFRHEAEKRLAEKDEEIEAIRWVNQFNKYNNSFEKWVYRVNS
jgi:hypothetical protein